MPPAATNSKYGRVSKSYILTPPRSQGHVMSVKQKRSTEGCSKFKSPETRQVQERLVLKCEQPKGELTVQVWLLYDHPNFKYCTLFVSGMELWTSGRSNSLMPPADLSGWGHKKSHNKDHVWHNWMLCHSWNTSEDMSHVEDQGWGVKVVKLYFLTSVSLAVQVSTPLTFIYKVQSSVNLMHRGRDLAYLCPPYKDSVTNRQTLSEWKD